MKGWKKELNARKERIDNTHLKEVSCYCILFYDYISLGVANVIVEFYMLA